MDRTFTEPPVERCQAMELLSHLDPDFRDERLGSCREPAEETVESWKLCPECARLVRAMLEKGPPWPWA